MSFCSVTDQCSLVFFGSDRRHFLSIFHLFQCLIPSRVRGAFTSCSCSRTTYRRFEERPPPAQHGDSVQGQAVLARRATSPEVAGGDTTRAWAPVLEQQAASSTAAGLAPGVAGRGQVSAAAQHTESQGHRLAVARGLVRMAALLPRQALSAASLRETPGLMWASA